MYSVVQLALVVSEKFRPVRLTIFIEHKACGMRAADGTDIFRRVHPPPPPSSASLLPRIQKPISSLISYIKSFISSPNTIYKRHKYGFHCASLGVAYYDMTQDRKESSLKIDS
jgi:hypothetical protein